MVMPGPIVSVPESPPLLAVLIWLAGFPPNTIEPCRRERLVALEVEVGELVKDGVDGEAEVDAAVERQAIGDRDGPNRWPVMSSVPLRVMPESVPPELVPTSVTPLVRPIVPPLIVPPESVSEALSVAVVSIERLPAESEIGS